MYTNVSYECRDCGYETDESYKDMPVFSPIGKPPQKCVQCGEKGTMKLNPSASGLINAVMVEIQDIGSFSEIERLHVILFDDDTRNIGVGEQVIVTGTIHVMQPPGGNRTNKKMLSYVFAKKIEYEQREQLELSALDIDGIKRLKKREGDKNIITKLVSMFAPDIIGNDIVKRGLLFSAINSGADSPKKRERLNALLVGPPGLAKSRLMREAINLVPNSRFESGQSSSGKSLTAIVSKEEETYVLRLGPVPLAKDALLSLNEFGRLEHSDQAQLLDVMQEGIFTINKFGINATIRSPTTIIASANPIGTANWDYGSGKIDFEDIPAMKPIVDRFDMIFIIRSDRENEEANLRYAYKKMELLENDRIPDYYRLLKRYILYAKRFNPRISQEAKIMFSNFYKSMVRGFGSPRLLDTLINIAKAISKLKLKDEVDANDATEALDFYNALISHHRDTINLPRDPKNVAFTEAVQTIRRCKAPIHRDEVVRIICLGNEQLEAYLKARPLRTNTNKPLQVWQEMPLNHSNIRSIAPSSQPPIFIWVQESRDEDCRHKDEGEGGE
jgi:replicative DNA helicase Mcm